MCCCGHSRERKKIVAVNVTYFIFGFLYFFCGTFGSILTKLPIIKGNMACGIILMIVSLFGLLATCWKNRLLLLIYVGILILLSISQLSISIACFSVSKEREAELMEDAWNDCDANNIPYIHDAEMLFMCCGYDENDYRRDFENMENKTRLERLYCFGGVENCARVTTTTTTPSPPVNTNVSSEELEATTQNPIFPTFSPDDLVCGPCKEGLVGQTHQIFNFQGGIALVVAFLELIPIFLAYKQWKHESRTEEEIVLNSF